SPELLPGGKAGAIAQMTETIIGPDQLHGFFLYHVVRLGSPPEKILFLGRLGRFAPGDSVAERRHPLKGFLVGLAAAQFQRPWLPDGPEVGSVSVSPRGDWRMPSDADATLWLRWAEGDDSS